MNKQKSTSRDAIETGAERSKEVFETFSTATNEAASAMQNCCSTALKGMQDYSSKVIEFAQSNTKSYVDFLQKLAGVKSPSEFMDVSTEHSRNQLETLAEQSKQLAALAQQVTLGFAKATIVPH